MGTATIEVPLRGAARRGDLDVDRLTTEPQVLKHPETAYGRAVDVAEDQRMAEAWRPWRTGVTVMPRALGGRADAGG